MSQLETREFQIRTTNDDAREVAGIAVPWDVATDVGGYSEIIERGAVEPAESVKLYWRHNEPIGVVTEYRDGEDGWEITAKISATARGDEAYTLLRDGVIDKFSIGFQPIEHQVAADGLTVTRSKIRVHEVSLVPFPAYEGAQVSQVREASNEKKEDSMSTAVTTADLAEVRESFEALEREVKMSMTHREPEQSGDVFRSAGDMIKRIASGEDAAIRAYNGAVSGDAILKDAWIGNYTEILKKKRPVLSNFASGSLPSEGLTVEYGELESDTTQAGIQAAEGDDLLFGKVSITTKNAPVKTLGGWSSLSRQTIERANVGILDTTWEAMQEKYARASETYVRSILNAAIAATAGSALATVTSDLTTQNGIVAAVMDLVEHYENTGRTLDGVYVDKATFLALYGVPATDRVLQISGQPSDKVGSLNVTTGSGDVVGLNFSLLPGAAANTVLAYDKTAIKTLESGGAPFRLQDENIVNLSKDFSLYGYLSSFIVKRDGLVKVVKGS